MINLLCLTEEQARIATDAIGKWIVDSRCTCTLDMDGDGLCEQCMAYFVNDPPGSYEKAIKAEAKKVWQEHVR